MTTSRHINAPRRTWTAADLATLRALYPNTRTADLADQLGIPLALVYSQASRMGLRKSAEFHATDKSGRIFKGGTLGQVSQFKPGHQAWNAGKHYQAGGRSAETRFKPGNAPHTTLPVGSYRIVTHHSGSQHLERKTSEAKGSNDKRWTPVTRLVWEQAHGPVPRGHIVVFKPGRQTLVLEHITLDAVECITRREIARRNHPNSSNPELAKLIQLKGAITRQVNRITREAQAS
jgi:hypothetical protein